MKFFYLIKYTFSNLKSNKVRSVLTMLGIIIGITSVTMMMSIGQGAQDMILGQITAAGSNNIYVEPGSWDKHASFSEGYSSAIEEMTIKTLKIEDAEEIKKDTLVELAAPYAFGVARVVYRNVDEKITYHGTTPASHQIDEAYPIIGRGLLDEDVKTMAKVAVLGYKIKQDLFGEENPIGEKIRIKKVNFRVVGVLEEQGTQMFQNLDEVIYIPVTTAQKLLLGVNHVRWIIVKVRDENTLEQVTENIRLTLRENHNIDNPENDLSKDDFKVMTQVEASEMMSQVTGIMTAFLSSIAAIALIVGGIGIMNIMLVSVTERTKEIGLRKAIGARKKDILYQFLLEAITLTVVGGATGVFLGIALSYLISLILGHFLNMAWNFAIPLNALILAFTVAAATGLIFGIYPAKKAAKLDPIEALRYE